MGGWSYTVELPGVVYPDSEFAQRLRTQWWVLYDVVSRSARRRGWRVTRGYGRDRLFLSDGDVTPLGALAVAFGCQASEVAAREWLDRVVGRYWCDGFWTCLQCCDQSRPSGMDPDYDAGWRTGSHLFSAW